MFAFTDKPQTLFQLWTHGLNLFKMSIKSVWYWALLLSVFANIFPQIILKKTMASMATVIHSEIIALLVGLLIIFPIIVFLSSILIQRVYIAGARKTERLHTSILHVSKKILPLSFSVILISFMTTIGLYLMLIPGLFLLVLFIFVVPLILIDNHKVWEAFKTSAYLVWGNWWRIFAIVLFPICLIILASLLASHTPALFRYIFAIASTSILAPLFYSMLLNGFSDAKLRHAMKPFVTKMPKSKVTGAAKG